LPKEYVVVAGRGDTITYKNGSGETISHYTYMHHDGRAVIVDEFRKLFPHDSVLVLLYDSEGGMYLQKRSEAMRWEPGKIDLASVAAQRRAILVGDHYEAVDCTELALAKVAEETGLSPHEIKPEYLTVLGVHQNATTNEFQTVYAYHLEANPEQLNAALAMVDDPYKAQWWEKRRYAEVIGQYMGDGVDEYAGGQTLRPLNFISNQSIRSAFERLIGSW
jgi:hypothetical protein